MEELQATKAALFLEGSEGNFELATSYGFGRRDALPRPHVRAPALDWVRRNRTSPAYLNTPQEVARRCKPLLEGALTSRLITIPLALAGRLVGLVDARDKSRGQRSAPEDLTRGEAIGRGARTLRGGTTASRFLTAAGADPAKAPGPAGRGAPRVESPVTPTVGSSRTWPALRALVGTPSRGRGRRAHSSPTGAASARWCCARPRSTRSTRARFAASHQARTLLESGVTAPPAEALGVGRAAQRRRRDALRGDPHRRADGRPARLRSCSRW